MDYSNIFTSMQAEVTLIAVTVPQVDAPKNYPERLPG